MLASFAADWKILALPLGWGVWNTLMPPMPMPYLADMFGTQFVGAIHGRLLTAWSTAGIVGPVIVNYMHDRRSRFLRAPSPRAA